MAKEYDVQVWATDLWIAASDNWKRIREAGIGDRVYPIHAEAHALPYADGFFDAIVSLDSYHYFGTDVEYLERHMLNLLKPGGRIGVISPASPRGQLPVPMPAHLADWLYFMNAVDWWAQHWRRCPAVEIECAEPLPGGWALWVHWHRVLEAAERAEPHDQSELDLLLADGGQYMGFVRLVGKRRC